MYDVINRSPPIPFLFYIKVSTSSCSLLTWPSSCSLDISETGRPSITVGPLLDPAFLPAFFLAPAFFLGGILDHFLKAGLWFKSVNIIKKGKYRYLNYRGPNNRHIDKWNVTPLIFEGGGRYSFAAFYCSLL